MSFFYQTFPGTIVKKALFPSRLIISWKWFSRGNFHFCCFLWILSGKLPAVFSKNGLSWEKNNWREWFLLRMIWFLILFSSFWTKVVKFRTIIFNRDVNTATSAPRWITSRETFFSNELSLSICFRSLRTKILYNQCKKNQDLQNCI